MAVLIIMGSLAAGILAADAPLLTVAGASALMLGIAIILRPDVATLTTIAILYTNAAVVAVRFHGVPLFVGAFVPLLLVVPLARDLVVRRLPVVAPPMLGWMVVLLFIYLLSALFSSDTSVSWDAVVVFLVEGFGLYFLLINVIRTPEMLRSVTWVLLISGALVSVLAVHQAVTSNYDSNYLGFAQADSAIRTGATTLAGDVLQPRMAGPIGETNRFAQTMLMLVPLGPLPRDRRTIDVAPGHRRTHDAGDHARRRAVVLARWGGGSGRARAGAHGAPPRAGAARARARARARGHPRRLPAVHEPADLPRRPGRVRGSTSSAVTDTSLLSRATETLAAALVIVDHPVLGVGPDMFPVYYEEYAQVVGILIRNDAAREAHNLYLGIGAELGIPGLIVFLIIAGLTVRMILAARRASLIRRPDLERLTTPYLLALLTYYVTGLFLHLSFGRFYWLMLAVAGAAAIITLRETAADTTSDQGAISQSV